jgi:cell division protein FtsB
METEKKLIIISDDGNDIQFDDILIKHDNVRRDEIAEIEKEIEQLETNKAEIEAKINDLKAQIIYAKEIIAIADDKKKETETQEVEV